MVTGIETAGLVLEVLPLLIAALEDYKRGLKPLRRLLGGRLELEKLIRAFRDERFHFRVHLSIIIQSATPRAARSDSHQNLANVLVNGPARGDIETYLRGNDALEVFDGIISEHRILLENAIKHLEHIRRLQPGANSLDQVIQANPAVDGEFSFITGLKFTIKFDRMQTIANDLEKCNANFTRLVNGIAGIRKLELKNPDATETLRSITQSLSNSRNQALRVHTAIANGWMAMCHTRHEAMMILERYQGLTKLPEGQAPQVSVSRRSFSVVLSTEQGPMHETKVTIYDDVPSPPPNGQEVLDLCQHIEVRRQINHALVLNLTKDEKLLCDEGASCESCLDLHDCGIISLNEYLTSKYSLLVKQRTTLALKLVTSVVQFHGTPWSSEAWTKEGVQFFRRQNSPGVSASVDTPFVVRRFPPTAPLGTKGPIEMEMLELGIMLIEVWEQRTFEEWATEEGLGAASSDYLERMKRAIRWMESVTDPMMIWYEDAVSTCLRFDFGNLPRDWEDARFRQGYCEKVILPLFKTCNAWERKGR